MTQKNMIHSYADHEGEINAVRFHPDGTCIASASADKTIKVWDIRSQRLIQHYDAHADGVTSLSFHPNGRFIISTSNDSTLKVWDLSQGRVLYTLYGHEGPSNAVHFSPCGDYFTSAGADSIVMVWKSNLMDADQEVIEDLGATAAGPSGGVKAPGGIASNRKTKAPANMGQSRYQSKAQPTVTG